MSSEVKLALATSPYWGAIAALLTYLGISHEAFVALTIFMVADFAFGFLASIRMGTTTSKAMWNGGLKKMSLLLMILLSAYYAKSTDFMLDFFSVGLISLLIHAEFLSLSKNFYAIWTGEKIKEVDIVKSLLEKIVHLVQAAIQSAIENAGKKQ